MENNLYEEIASNFKIGINEIEKFNVLIWSYGSSGWDGDAILILEDKETEELFEVHGSHCSCYGLEGQFDLEPTTAEEIKFRLDNNPTYGQDGTYDHCFREDLIKIIDERLLRKN